MASKKKAAASAATAEEKAAKRAKRMEALKNRPEGQRPNSKQVDVIEIEGAGKVINFGAPVRKVGTLVTSVALNPAGEIVSTSVTLIEGVSVKTKKGHGYLKPGAPGMGKDHKEEAEAETEKKEAGNEED